MPKFSKAATISEGLHEMFVTHFDQNCTGIQHKSSLIKHIPTTIRLELEAVLKLHASQNTHNESLQYLVDLKLSLNLLFSDLWTQSDRVVRLF